MREARNQAGAMTMSIKNPRDAGRRRRMLAGILAAMVPAFLAVREAGAQAVRLERPNSRTVEVSGGPAASRWRLQYGGLEARHRATLHLVPPNRAYFGHGSWLRQIDTDSGTVI